MTFKLWDRIRDWVLLSGLLAVAVIFMLAKNEPLVRGLRKVSLETTAWIESQLTWFGGYFQALKENALLREENIRLSSELARSREAGIENDHLRSLLAFDDSTSFDLLAARVVAKDITRQQNIFTINVGSTDSVAVGMGVIDERGILGKVVLVSPHYARIMPYLNTDFRVPAKIQHLNSFGIVRWEGDRSDRLLLEHIVKTEPVMREQLVVTSGYSETFPPGFSIGIIDSIATRPGRNEMSIFLKPSAPLYTAEHVFVIRQSPDPERTDLEASDIH